MPHNNQKYDHTYFEQKKLVNLLRFLLRIGILNRMNFDEPILNIASLEDAVRKLRKYANKTNSETI